MRKVLYYIVVLLPFLLTVVFCIKSIREPDLWWQIRTGEWIIANNSIPKTDIFSMTYAGVPWINIKWGFEVLAAATSKIFSPDTVYLWQALVSITILLLLRKIVYSFFSKNDTVFLLVTIFYLIATEYRMIARPEMFSHLGVILFIYVWLLYKQKNIRYAWLFIPLQIIWTNMHEAYGIGIVLLFIFLACEWWLYWQKKENKPWLLTAIVLLALAGLCINPNGYHLLLRPFNIFAQLQQNKFTTELVAVYDKVYWEKEAYLFLFSILLISILFLKHKNTIIAFARKNQSFIAYLLVVIAFTVLALLAYRNIIFFFIIIFPILYYLLSLSIQHPSKWQLALIVAGLLLYGMIVTDYYYKTVNSRDRYGLAILGDKNPVGAAEYIAAKGLSNKKCFSDYLSSSYLLWRLQPDFKTYIDLRDLDIYPSSFFDHYGTITENKDSFFSIDKKYNFEYVVLYRPIHTSLHYALYNDSIFACVYADKTAVIYQKTDSFSRGDIFAIAPNLPVSKLSGIINKFFNPFYTEYKIDAIKNDYYAAEFYATVGKLKIARDRIDAYHAVYPDNEEGNLLRQKIYSIIQQYNIQ